MGKRVQGLMNHEKGNRLRKREGGTAMGRLWLFVINDLILVGPHLSPFPPTSFPPCEG